MSSLVANPQYSISPIIDQGTETLFYNFSNIMQEAYVSTPPIIVDKLAMEVAGAAGDGLTLDLYWQAMVPALKVWTGSRVYKNVISRTSIFRNIRFEDTLQLDRNVVENDKNGVFSRTAELLGKQMARWGDQQATLALICGRGNHTAVAGEDAAAVSQYNANATAYWDGVPYFSLSHPVSLGNATLGIQANLQTSVSDLNESTLASAIELLQQQKNEDGLVAGFGTEKVLLIVPPSLFFKAKRLVSTEFFGDELSSATAGSVTNFFRGMVDVCVNKYISETGTWFVADMSLGVKGLAFVRSAAEMVVLSNPANSLVFERDVIIMGAKMFGGVAYGSSLPIICATNLSA